MYPGAWHVYFSIFFQNDDGRKEECKICVFSEDERHDPLCYSESSVDDQTLSCSISEGVCYISLKEVSLVDIVQGSLSKNDFLSSLC